jgi:hypothetical protein
MFMFHGCWNNNRADRAIRLASQAYAMAAIAISQARPSGPLHFL